MQYEIHYLELYEPLVCGVQSDNGNGRVIQCTAAVTKKNMDPKPEEYIEQSSDNTGTIPSGHYFFVQGFIPSSREPFLSTGRPCAEIAEAAQSLWLEFVWQEKTPDGSGIYLRILHEDIKKSAGTVFQLFRPISK
jgi:hypothetical protein